MWIPLHVHSQYSILDSTASIEDLIAKATFRQLPAVALTDQGNLYGVVEFFKACKNVKIKPIIGCELVVAPFSRKDKKRLSGFPSGFPLILLAKNKKGYQNLCKLSSIAHLEGFYYTPRIDKEVLSQHAEGLICLSGPLEGSVASFILQDKEKELREEIGWYQTIFKEDYYFELQRSTMAEEDIQSDGMDRENWLFQNYLDHVQNQEKVIHRLKELSQECGIAYAATQPVHYLERADWRAHEILINIQSGEPCEIWEKDSAGNPKARVLNPKRQTLASHEFYFKSPEQMERLFSDLPKAVQTTLEIADKCCVELDLKSKYYPVFIPPHLEGTSFTKEERIEETAKFLRTLCNQGIEKRYGPEQLAKVKEKYPDKDPMQVVRDRLEGELALIISKGMADYLLIVYDFIAWAKKKGILMGPGRGSGAGSIVLYLIEVTDIEPLRFNLFFERFINPQRLSYPDIDVDMCMERRSEVIDYTVQKYGKDRVAQIITFGTMKAKMALKDVGRVLSMPLPKVNAIAKLIPEELNITLDKALETDPDLRQLYEMDREVKELIDIAKKLEGSVRSTGVHAAGIIICEDPIIEHIPVCVSKDSEMMTTQFSMKPVEAVGMLKIDFLGLKTLTSIQKTIHAVKLRQGKVIDWINLPLEDKSAFELLNQGKTLGVFQLESGGMQDLAKQLHIDKFEEIIAVGALYRPGPMEMIPSFINRKHGRETIEIDHPLMHDILAETYGIMVYQEQVMQIASRLAQYSLGEGDVLRRAMGKKDREEMARQREKFREGAQGRGIDEETSMRIFDKVEKFASYGFNKSHAAAYGYLTYVTAYLKAHYPKEWMAALMTCDRYDLSKVTKIIRECKAMHIAILPPDINESGVEFVATSNGIRFAMTAIKGVGEGVVDLIVAERQHLSAFKSLYDFLRRIDTTKIGKKVIESLILAGCFDFTSASRVQMLENLEEMYTAASHDQKEAAKGVITFFSLMQQEEKERFTVLPPSKGTFSKQALLKKENELLGFYLTGHPLDDFEPLLPKLSCVPLAHIAEQGKEGVQRVAFIIETIQVKISKSQKKFAILTISDATHRFELPVWSDLYEEKNHLLVENQLIYAVIQTAREEEELKLHCRWLADLAGANQKMIEECDQAYERAKRQNKGGGRGFKEKPKASLNIQQMRKLKLKLNIDLIKLSHILEMKKIFRAYPGTMPLCLEFFREEAKIGALEIDASWGVQPHPSFEGKLREIAAVKEITVS